MAKDRFPEHGTAMQKTKWARDQLRGMVSPEELDATTKRAYELERAVEQARKGRK